MFRPRVMLPAKLPEMDLWPGPRQAGLWLGGWKFYMRAISASLVLAGAVAAGSFGAFADGGPTRGSLKDAPPPFSWTGFYVGGNLGYHGVDVGRLSVNPADAFTANLQCAAIVRSNPLCDSGLGSGSGSGAIGGLQAGYSWQFGSAVAGIEADLQGSTAGATQWAGGAAVFGGFNLGQYSNQSTTNVEWMGTVRGRLGFLLSPMFLVYATGGFAYGGIDRSWSYQNSNGFIANIFGRDKYVGTGWTAGGGIEWAVGNRVSLGAEYLYATLAGGNDYSASNPAAPTIQSFTIRHLGDVDNHIARLKLNFKL